MFQRLKRKILNFFRPQLYPPLGRLPETDFQYVVSRYSVPTNYVRPRVSVIIPSFNQPDLLSNCLNSIAYFSLHPKLEVIVVDNNSDAATREVLANYAPRPNWRIVYNPINRGFGPAINQGLQLATGDFLILLNNDTIVTPFWLDRLTVHFRDRIGLIGPVTNSAGNRQKILTPKLDNLDAIVYFSDRNFAANIGRLQPAEDRLGFFCVALSRAAYEQIGLFDEQFAHGYFEDDDYCRRAQKLGWEMKIIKDVFIYHAGGASFGQLPDPEWQKIWQENKARFETKWGIKWQPPK
jgi:GT2 family glycosyltransferase